VTTTTHLGPTRAQFLRRGAAGTLALVAGGSVLAAAGGPAAALAAGGGATTDVDIAKLAATAELLAVDFYTRCIDSGVFGGRRERYLRGARENERDHFDALAGLIGAEAPRNLRFAYPAGTFGSRTAASRTGIALETAFIGAYLGAIEALQDTNLKVVAGQIGANEFGHYIVFTDILTGLPVGPSFPGPKLTPAQAGAALGPFLA
jgi:ferritin-like protein